MAPTHPDSPAAVAAFDLDGTLTQGGSVIHWLAAVAGRRAMRSAVVRHGAGLLTGAARSGPAADAAKQDLFEAVLAGRAYAEVAEISAGFADEHLRTSVRAVVAGRLVDHLEAGHVVVVVSASPALYVERIAASLGAHGAAATELAVDQGGLLTGRYEGANCRGDEKLRRVRALLGTLGVGETGPSRPLYAYGNSRGDLRLLGGADIPVDCSRLGALGALRRFPRLFDAPLGEVDS